MDDGVIAAALRGAYGFDEAAVGERLEGGYANDLFRVVADGELYVLRIKHPPAIEDDIAWEHRLVRLLSVRLPEVAAPIPAREGDTIVRFGDRVGWLMPFIDGTPAEPGREEHRAAAARGLGRLHRAGAAVALPRRPRLRPLPELNWPPLAATAELHEWRSTIAKARAWAIACVSQLAERRRPVMSLIHGDFFPGNVLVSSDALVGLIDWEEAQIDWPVWDLAGAIGSFCCAGDDLDLDACRRFVDDYRSAGGIAPPRDDDLLVPLVRVKRILEVLRAPTDRHPRWEHQRRNLRSLENLGR
jgi:Ser/Thr protein kinase RdoA (MazF antagonist)